VGQKGRSLEATTAKVWAEVSKPSPGKAAFPVSRLVWEQDNTYVKPGTQLLLIEFCEFSPSFTRWKIASVTERSLEQTVQALEAPGWSPGTCGWIPGTARRILETRWRVVETPGRVISTIGWVVETPGSIAKSLGWVPEIPWRVVGTARRTPVTTGRIP